MHDRRRRGRPALRHSKPVRAASQATLRAASAVRWAAWCFPARFRIGSRRASAARAFRSRSINVLGAGDAFMSGFLRGWLRGRAARDLLRLRQCLRRLRRIPPAVLPGKPDLGRAQLFPQARSAGIARCASTRSSTIFTGRRRAPAAAGDHGARDRPSHAAGSDGRRGRCAPRDDQRLQAAGRAGGGPRGRGASRLRHVARRSLRARSAVPRGRSRPLDRPAGRASRSRVRSISNGGSLGANLVEWPVAQVDQMPLLLSPRRSAGAAARQERELLRVYDACRTLGRDLLIEIIASKHGPVQDDTIARVIERLYAIGVKPDWWKLEGQTSAAAWSAIGGASRPATRYAAAWWCSASRRRRTTLRRPSPSRDLRSRQGLRGRPHDLCRAGASNGSAAALAIARRSSGWRTLFERLCMPWRDAAPASSALLEERLTP